MKLKEWLERATDPEMLKELLEKIDDGMSQAKLMRGERPDLVGDARGAVVSALVDGMAEAAKEVLARRYGVPVEVLDGHLHAADQRSSAVLPAYGAFSRAVGDEAVLGGVADGEVKAAAVREGPAAGAQEPRQRR